MSASLDPTTYNISGNSRYIFLHNFNISKKLEKSVKNF